MAGRATIALRAMTTAATGAEPSERWRRFARRGPKWRTSRNSVARIAPASATRAAAARTTTTRVTSSANGPASISANSAVPAHATRTGGPGDEDGADERKDLRELFAEGRRR